MQVQRDHAPYGDEDGEGDGDGDVEGVGDGVGKIVNVYCALLLRGGDSESVTVTVKLYVPTVVGVPII